MKYTWKEIVEGVKELLIENTVETYLDECDECDGPMGSVDFILTNEYEQFIDNLEDELSKVWDELLKKAEESIKEEEEEEEEEE